MKIKRKKSDDMEDRRSEDLIGDPSFDSFCDYLLFHRGSWYNFVMEAENSRMFVKKSRKEHNRGKLPENENVLVVMEQVVWERTPEDMLEAILARLPVATFCRFRSVCRKWNSLLYSQSFCEHCAQVPQAVIWFYTNTVVNVMGAMYDPSSKKWYNPTISLPTNALIMCASSAGGLVCIFDIHSRNLFMCNPLTRSFRELPSSSLHLLGSAVVGITVNVKSVRQDYKILCVTYNGDYEIYDSTTNAWCRKGNMPSSIKMPLSSVVYRFESVSNNSTMYFRRSEPEGIISFNLETGTWKEFIVPTPKGVEDDFLAECDGRIMLVGLLNKSDSTYIYIWELQEMRLLWEEVDKMPSPWEFYPRRFRLNCLGNKGLFLMSLQFAQLVDLEVTYNARNREWHRVPEYIVPPRNKRQRFRTG